MPPGRLLSSPRWTPDPTIGDPTVGNWREHCRWMDGILERARGLGFEGNIWEIADGMAAAFEQLNELHAKGKMVIT